VQGCRLAGRCPGVGNHGRRLRRLRGSVDSGHGFLSNRGLGLSGPHDASTGSPDPKAPRSSSTTRHVSTTCTPSSSAACASRRPRCSSRRRSRPRLQTGERRALHLTPAARGRRVRSRHSRPRRFGAKHDPTRGGRRRPHVWAQARPRCRQPGQRRRQASTSTPRSCIRWRLPLKPTSCCGPPRGHAYPLSWTPVIAREITGPRRPTESTELHARTTTMTRSSGAPKRHVVVRGS
jgi:hypothetical protein